MKEQKTFDNRLENFISKYGSNIDTQTLLLKINLDSSDMVFQQHIKSSQTLNIILISTQLLLTVLGMFSSIFNWNIVNYTLVLNIFILFVVVINNFIHSKTWEMAKDKLQDIDVMLNILVVNAKSEILTELKEEITEIKDDLDNISNINTKE